MSETVYDIVIIGAGPAGYVAGIRAAQLGLSACVIEKDKAGGVCLNIGCIPSKALIHQAEVFASYKDLQAMGVKVDLSGLDYSQVFKKSRTAADTLSNGVNFLLKKNKVPLIAGEAKISGKGEVTLKDGTKVRGKNILVATGSSPKNISGFEFDEKLVISSTGALMLEKLPKRVFILGGGAIGCEFAHVFNAFGTEVVIAEMLDHLLPLEDAET
ncbi:MAG TPA: FAD-dependent oxidoreductase, partial [Spirochaetia bacterium]|nr:FAD-dependent oxidoreductase [Spirochaetia bacterium]